MWVETHDGDLVNLDHVSRLFVATDRGDRQVCLYARLDEKKDVGCAHVDFVLAVFPIDSARPLDAATDQARRTLLGIRERISDRQELLAVTL